jgi:hypothetical protein
MTRSMQGKRSVQTTLVMAAMMLVQAGQIHAATIGPDTYGYTMTSDIPYEFTDISSFGFKVMAGFSEGFALSGIPFDFNFYGTNYRNTRISVNGVFFFGNQGVNDSFNVPLNDPTALGNLPVLVPLWDDLVNQPNTPQQSYITTLGQPGSRRHIVQWNSSNWTGPANNSAQFQIVLYEGSNDIQMNYLDVGFGVPALDNGASATVGLRNSNGELSGEFLQWSHNKSVLHDRMSLRIHREPLGPPQTLVPVGSVWKYWDLGGNQGTRWRDNDFDDSSWAEGPAQLGYGDNDEATEIRGADTIFRPTTNYFRHEFDINDPASIQSLSLKLLRDDGAAVYLNGFEIARDRLIEEAAFSDYAMGAPVEGIDESRYYAFNVSPSFLRAGRNVLAVEIHQSPDSADLSFDLQLTATRFAVPEPSTFVLLSLGAFAATIGYRRRHCSLLGPRSLTGLADGTCQSARPC